MKGFFHFLILIGAIAIGTLLRFYHLDFKPLWQDEVITALLSLGRSYTAVPLDQAVSLPALADMLTLKPASCAQIAQTVMTESVHPPLFFCGLHGWLVAVQTWSQTIVWKLRALPALAGVGAIAIVYALNRIGFSPRAGLMAAWVMAVSPFAVYLSQEARHYTFPMVLITGALVCLVKIHQDLRQGKVESGVWIVWVVVNSVGFYIHYFFLLAVIAQVVTLIGVQVATDKMHQRLDNILGLSSSDADERPVRSGASLPLQPRRSPSSRQVWLTISFAISTIVLIYLPWLPIFLQHLSRPETDWLKPFAPSWIDAIAPLGQLPVGWLLMVIALPIEQKPLWIAIPAVFLTLLFAIGLIRQGSRRLRQIWRDPDSRLSILVLSSFLVWVLIEFLAIVYLLHKDITQVPRYNFIYYPAVCALLGLVFVQEEEEADQHERTTGRLADRESRAELQQLNRKLSERSLLAARCSPHAIRWLPGIVLLTVGLLSSLFVITDQVLHKPYFPQQVAQDITADHSRAVLVVMSYENLQDVALGLSFALALQRAKSTATIEVAFMSRSPSYAQLWQKLATLQSHTESFDQLWIVAPGLRQRDFLAQLTLAKTTCQLNAEKFRRIGIPYQGYQCQ